MDYSQLLDNILFVRVKYLASLTLCSFAVAAVLTARVSFVHSLFGFCVHSVCSCLLLWFQYKQLKQKVNFANQNLQFVDFTAVANNVFLAVRSFNKDAALKLLIHCVYSLLFFVYTAPVHFKNDLHFLNSPLKHQLPTINSKFFFFYSYALFNGVANFVQTSVYNEHCISVDVTSFHSSPKRLFRKFFTLRNYKALLLQYSSFYVRSFAVFTALYYLTNLGHYLDKFCTFFISASEQNGVSVFQLGFWFCLKLLTTSIILKTLQYTVLHCYFNSYTMLGCLHFQQYVSSYSNEKNDTMRFQIIVNALKNGKNDKFSEITAIQEFGLLASERSSFLYTNLSQKYFFEFLKDLEMLLQENTTLVNGKLQQQIKQKLNTNINVPRTSGTKVKIIKDAPVLKSTKRNFVVAIFDKLLQLLQDNEYSESTYAAEVAEKYLKLLKAKFGFVKSFVAPWIQLQESGEAELKDPIGFYLKLRILTILLKNMDCDPKFNNKVLASIDRILKILATTCQFCENYSKLNKISLSDANLTSYINYQYNQYRNEYLVIKMYRKSLESFETLVSSHNSILTELKLDESVEKLMKKLSKPEGESGYKTFDIAS